jgi:proline iminopeptidase
MDMTESLQQVDVPTLLLGGRHDWVALVEQGTERLHKALSNSEMVVFEESGHFPFIEEPGRFVSTVMAWLQGLAR